MNQKSIRIVADAHIWCAKEAFSEFEGYQTTLQTLENKDIKPESIRDVDILLTRSSTKVNQVLLDGSQVRFAATATIGDDHYDKAYLERQGITFASAAGSSTESVIEYMIAVLEQLKKLGKLSYEADTLGIIGVGRIGGLLEKVCADIGLEVELNDPPRQQSEQHRKFRELEYLLKYADVLTLHTPLIKEGEFHTHHLIGSSELDQFKGKGIINAARGACLDNTALLNWLNDDDSRFAVLDCWEGEPNINLDLLNHPQVVIATPHIAGHSLDGKAANTYFIYKHLCDYLQVKPAWNPEEYLPEIDAKALPSGFSETILVSALYPITNDHNAMREAGKNEDTFSQWFQDYRRHYPIRRSWKKSLAQSEYDEDLFY